MSFQEEHAARVAKARQKAIDASLGHWAYDFFYVACVSRRETWAKPFVLERNARRYVMKMRVKYPLYWAIARNGVFVDEGDPATRLQE